MSAVLLSLRLISDLRSKRSSAWRPRKRDTHRSSLRNIRNCRLWKGTIGRLVQILNETINVEWEAPREHPTGDRRNWRLLLVDYEFPRAGQTRQSSKFIEETDRSLRRSRAPFPARSVESGRRLPSSSQDSILVIKQRASSQGTLVAFQTCRVTPGPTST
jgi:hypothetical protein